MPFWKKSEDPWDTLPSAPKPRAAGQDLMHGPEEMAARVRTAGKTAAEPETGAEPCPWCKQSMERGYLHGRGWIYWQRQRPRAVSLTGHAADAWVVNDEGGFASSYKTTWYCPACEKIVMDAPAQHSAPGSLFEEESTEKTEE